MCHILTEGEGVIPLARAKPRDQLHHRHYRLNDFYNLSEAARHLILHPTIARFFGLAFNDAPVADRGRTRKSFVSHYSSATAYQRDQRAPDRVPKTVQLNNGLYYAWDMPGYIENRYRLTAPIGSDHST